MCKPLLASSFVEGLSSLPVIMGMVLITMQVQQSRNYTKFDMEGRACASSRNSREAQSHRGRVFQETFWSFAIIHVQT
jgi:hypothetical protein